MTLRGETIEAGANEKTKYQCEQLASTRAHLRRAAQQLLSATAGAGGEGMRRAASHSHEPQSVCAVQRIIESECLSKRNEAMGMRTRTHVPTSAPPSHAQNAAVAGAKLAASAACTHSSFPNGSSACPQRRRQFTVHSYVRVRSALSVFIARCPSQCTSAASTWTWRLSGR